MPATAEQKGRLAAGAQAGSEGAAAFNEAQRNVASSRDAAIRTMNAENRAVGAPSALNAQFAKELSAPAATALSNLGAASGYASNMDAQDQAGTNNYMNEANAALPLIRSEADRDLGQKIALLNASRSGGGGGGGRSGGGGGVSGMSDSELRNRLMGVAQQIRDTQAQVASAQQAAQHGSDQALAAIRIPQVTSQPNGYRPSGSQSGSLFTQNPDERYHTQRAMWNDQYAGQANHGSNYVQEHPGDVMGGQKQWLANATSAYQAALQKITNLRYGPGIVNEARQVGAAYGVPAERTFGALPDSLEKTWEQEQIKLGRYQDPNKVSFQSTPLSADQVSKVGIFDPSLKPETRTQLADHPSVNDIQKAEQTRYFDWQYDKGLQGAFSKWLDNGGVGQQINGQPVTMQAINSMDPKQGGPLLAAAQARYEQVPTAQNFAKPVIDTFKRDAIAAIRNKGSNFDDWYRSLVADPAFSRYPREMGIAATMMMPLFQLAAAQQEKKGTVTLPTSATPNPYAFGQ